MKSIIEYLNESLIITNKPIVCDWDISKNILFITGISASGKTTLANTIAKKYNYQIITLDRFWNKLYGKKYDNVKDEDLSNDILDNYIKKMFEYIVSLSESKKRYIIEGIQLFKLYYELKDQFMDFIKKYPIIFLETSVLKSGIQGTYRYFKNNQNWPGGAKGPLYHYTINNIKMDNIFKKFKNDRIKIALNTQSVNMII